MITKYLRTKVEALTPRTRGVLLTLYGTSAAPHGFQPTIPRADVKNDGSTLKLTKREITRGLNEMKRLGMLTIDGDEVTLAPKLLRGFDKLDCESPPNGLLQSTAEYDRLRDFCYCEIPSLRKVRPQIWTETVFDKDLGHVTIAFEFTEHTPSEWNMRTQMFVDDGCTVLTINPWDRDFEGSSRLEVIAGMARHCRLETLERCRRNLRALRSK